jgi:hypothetical protein
MSGGVCREGGRAMYEQDLDKFYKVMEDFAKNLNDIVFNKMDIVISTALDIIMNESLEMKEKNLLIQADKTNEQPFTYQEVGLLRIIETLANGPGTMFRPNDMNIIVEKGISDTEYRVYIRTIF